MSQKAFSETFGTESLDTNDLVNKVRVDAEALKSLKGKCILQNNGLILGKNVYFFNDGSELADVLGLLAMSFDDCIYNGTSTDFPNYVTMENIKIRKVKREDFRQAKTICESMREAIDIVTERGVFRDSIVNLFNKDDNPFVLDIYSLNDALRFAIIDCKGSDDDIYEWFTGLYCGSNIWLSVMTFEQLLSLTRYYFDKNYRKIKEDMKRDQAG